MNVVVYEPLTPEQLVARWRQLMTDPAASDRCELDEYGDVVVSPSPSYWHQRVVAAVGKQLELQLGGETGSYAVATQAGVKMPDVCWAKDFDELARAGGENPLTVLPTICVEVVSPGERRKDLNEKVDAYLAAGVAEVILVEQEGRIRFFTARREQPKSSFSMELELPVR